MNAKREKRPRVLYVVYWGAAEPLGQSLVLPAVRRLAALGADLTLVTFEKPGDLERHDDIRRIRESLSDSGVRWIALRYHKHPKVPATAFDFFQGCARGVLSQLRCRPDIVHARTFVGGLMGLALSTVLRARLIYHNEGFYPDEQVDAGVWKLNSAPHRLAKSLERRMYSRADAVIALSDRAKRDIEGLAAVSRKGTPVTVVPSCVDLGHFQMDPRPQSDNGTMRFVYAGSVGGRYSLARIGRFVSIASREVKRAHLQVLTLSEPNLVAAIVGQSGLPDDQWSMNAVPYQAMPSQLALHQIGIHFLQQGLSDQGGSPTKIGEYWAAGLPVVVTANAGDTDKVIKSERVGVIVEEHSDDAYRQAALELRSLLEDDELSSRCRRAAETHYALEPACERQFRLYQTLASLDVKTTRSPSPADLSNSR